jgi:hypothetical protein
MFPEVWPVRLYFWMTFDLVVEPELLAAARGLMKTKISLSILEGYHLLFYSYYSVWIKNLLNVVLHPKIGIRKINS